MNSTISRPENWFSQVVRLLLVAGAAVLVTSCGQEPAGPAETVSEAAQPADVDTLRLVAADEEPGNWMAHGRTYSEQRFSPLEQINDQNVGNLGLAWYFDLDTDRGQEATPIVVDGVIYVSTAWSKVKALTAASGELIWEFDPEVPGAKAVETCCDVVNRGVAVWEGKVYAGTIDGRLIALDAADGSVVWETQTTDPDKPYSITGAPRIMNDKVVIGNGGAEFGVRGYVTAYDTDSGEQLWRFYTVPGNPADGFESEAMARAAETWTGEWWALGGGGTAWDAMVFDPELNLLFIGVGNGSPWNQDIRSPDGGDNLYLSSIVAVNADTGAYAWHYQTTPGETWDFTATQPLILAELEIAGSMRKVIMQAPKNGFFYVLDRETGGFISAEPFVFVNWASAIDQETGRPIENPEARYSGPAPSIVVPGPAGAHNWQPMSFSPETGLVYIPSQDAGFPFIEDMNFIPTKLGFNTGVDFNAGSMPQIPEVKEQIKAGVKGYLQAWDPVAQQSAWKIEHVAASNGGVLSTAGNLVVQGTAAGDFVIYRADNGDKLWSQHVQTGVLAAPVSYSVDGEQYIAVTVGWGGIWALPPGELGLKGGRLGNKSRVLAFKLGGDAELPPATAPAPLAFNPPEATASDETVANGKYLYHRHCVACHGDAAVSGGMLPDLRASPTLNSPELWNVVVLEGTLADRGMVGFAAEVNEEGSEAIRAYLVARAHESIALGEGAAP